MQDKSIRTIARILIGWLLVGLCASPGYGEDPQPTAPIGQAVTDFGFDVVRRVGRPTENLLVSPYSLATALAMVRSGAKGKTLEQMTQVLHLTGIPGSVDHRFGALQQQIVGTGENRASSGALRVANGLWAQAGYPFLPAFQQTAEEAYRAQVASADFKKNPDGERQAINGWVAKATADKILDLIPAGGVTQDTRLVLANALYFKNDWEKKFDPHQTHDTDFFVRGGTKAQVSTMSLHRLFAYAETDALKLLQMPYASGGCSMWIVLPKQQNGLGGVEQSLIPNMLDDIMRKAKIEDVVVSLPKFTFRSRFRLADTLRALGMPDAFSREADFSGMTAGKELKLAEVYHQTYVAVAEQGTEAAAATAASMMLAMAPQNPDLPKPVLFIADHPFLVFIRHDASGAMLFQGRVTDPRS